MTFVTFTKRAVVTATWEFFTPAIAVWKAVRQIPALMRAEYAACERYRRDAE